MLFRSAPRRGQQRLISRVGSLMSRLFMIIALAATVEASKLTTMPLLHATSATALPTTAAALESSSTMSVLALRGGGIVPRQTFIYLVFAIQLLYGVPFLLSPKSGLEGNYHADQVTPVAISVTRSFAVYILTFAATLWFAPTDVSFPLALITTVAGTLVGPVLGSVQKTMKPEGLVPAAILSVILIGSGLFAI